MSAGAVKSLVFVVFDSVRFRDQGLGAGVEGLGFGVDIVT